MPFDNKNGFTLSDGSTSIILENGKNAESRGAKKYAKLLGYGMAYKGVDFATLKGSDEALDRAINDCLKDANLTIDDIDTISGFANGIKEVDDIEINSLERVFGNKLSNINLLEVKSHIGEARASAASMALVHAALMLSGDIKKDNGYNISGGKVSKTVVAADKMKNVLVISYGSGGTYTAVVVSK